MSNLDPQVVLDSIGDGVAEVIKIYPRLIENMGGNAMAYGRDINNDLSALQRGMIEHPEALGAFVLGVVGHTFEAALGVPGGVAKAVGDSASGVRTQVQRVVG